jgi:hypothetical protein
MGDIADLIERGAIVLKDKGWCQGDLWKGGVDLQPYSGGAVCAIGALIVGAGGGAPDGEEHLGVTIAYRTVEEHLELAPGITLLDWNDQPGRTLDEVVTAFLDTARELRADKEKYANQ